MLVKVIHLNTYDGNGGAGRASLRLNNALKAQGVDSQVLVYYKFGQNKAITSFSNNLWRKGLATFNILAERYLSNMLIKPLKVPFSLQWFGQSVIDHPDVQSADIIHLHWINHGFLTPETLAKLNKLEKPVVWTFHDSNAFTGGCHVRYACEHFHQQCGNCPILRFSGKGDLSHRNWKRKQKAYTALNFHVVAPSHWMSDSVKFSSLMGARKVSVIPNTLETNVFKPYVKAEAKKILHISSEKFVMLSGFMPSKKDSHKGTQYLVEALNLLAARKGIDKHKIELVIFGNKNEKDVPEFPFKTTFLGTINKDEHLAKCYSAADVFLMPSLEDNLPNTVMESLACATPVVAFRTGGIPDMVNHMENGYLADYKSATDLADGIEWLYHHKESATLQRNARKTVLDYFSEDIIAEKHLELYQTLLTSVQQ